ncbi:MAG: hypothetical protein P4L27_06320 [Ignavibacteriaceae bacterium]|nr:hypothetical protein [Ignavibacteriaceae bacterium]
MLIITFLLFALIVFFLAFIRTSLTHKNQYKHFYNIEFQKLLNALEVLEEGNVGGYFGVKPLKGSFYWIYIIKNQDDKEWWFEIAIIKKYSEILNLMFGENKTENDFHETEIPTCRLNLKNFVRYKIGSDKNAIMILLSDYFTKAFNKQDILNYSINYNHETELLLLRFEYIETLKGFMTII